MGWAFPSRDDDPWFDAFEDFVRAVDASGFAHREDRSLILTGGGTVSWNAGTSTLAWTEALQFVSPTTGFLMSIPADSVTIANGELLYATLVRQALQTQTLSKAIANAVPSNDEAIMLCVRIGTRIYWRNGLMMNDGDSVSEIGSSQGGGGGGGGGFEADIVDRYAYTQAASPIEEVVGEGMVDGSRVGTQTAYFWVMMDPAFSVVGTAQVKLYDVGPQAGPRAAGVLVATLQATSGGLAYHEQALSVGVSPGANQIANVGRMYEVTVVQNSAPGDNVYVGCGGIAVR
jgi:hypothetical protein